MRLALDADNHVSDDMDTFDIDMTKTSLRHVLVAVNVSEKRQPSSPTMWSVGNSIPTQSVLRLAKFGSSQFAIWDFSHRIGHIQSAG